MRARNIKPSFFKNELLGVADPFLSLVFAGLWCAADRDGYLEDRPLRLKAEILPYRENIDFNGYLTELSRLGFIRRYLADDTRVIEVINFKKHQNPHHTEKKSCLPKFNGITIPCLETENSPLNNGETPVTLLLIPDSLIPDSKDKELSSPDSEDGEKDFYLSRKKRKLKGDSLQGFMDFWKCFSYAKGKAEAADAWIDVYSPKILQEILKSATAEAQNRGLSISQGKTPKMAQGWLSGRRWEDDIDNTSGNKCHKCTYEIQGVCHKTIELRTTCTAFQVNI